MADRAIGQRRASSRATMVVAEREILDLWLSGRGAALTLAYAVLLSVMTYVVATNQALNFLEQREAVYLTLQVAVAVGALLVLLGSADAISGERDRGTLETLLLTAAPRRGLVIGKGVAALSLWVAAFFVSVPYLWFVGRGVGVVGVALAGGLVVGTLLALFLAGLGLLISVIASSSRLSLSIGLFALGALYAPTLMPGIQKSWVGELLMRIDPITAGLHYLSKLIVDAHGAGQDASWLVGPAIAAVVVPAAALTLSGRISLRSGSRA